jgi:hypothetical protein
MKKEEYEKRSVDLFKRWIQARPEYIIEGRRFTRDGIINFELWEKSNPKILFLLKENHDPDWDPINGITSKANKFSRNIATWNRILKELYVDPKKELTFDNMELPEGTNDIAIVEIKKNNERHSNSPYREILKYAEMDKDFLREQIDLINPQIILCGYTGEAYGDKIYEDSWEELYYLPRPLNCRCLKHRNRLVIDFYHPSSIAISPIDYFDRLCKLIKEGNVFEKFDWNE